MRQIIIGIGGSATNDGGAGMAQALAKLLTADGQQIAPGAVRWRRWRASILASWIHGWQIVGLKWPATLPTR